MDEMQEDHEKDKREEQKQKDEVQDEQKKDELQAEKDKNQWQADFLKLDFLHGPKICFEILRKKNAKLTLKSLYMCET